MRKISRVKSVFNATGHSNTLTRTFEVCSLSANSGAKKGARRILLLNSTFSSLGFMEKQAGVKTF
jgi:hypothetical protein